MHLYNIHQSICVCVNQSLALFINFHSVTREYKWRCVAYNYGTNGKRVRDEEKCVGISTAKTGRGV